MIVTQTICMAGSNKVNTTLLSEPRHSGALEMGASNLKKIYTKIFTSENYSLTWVQCEILFLVLLSDEGTQTWEKISNWSSVHLTKWTSAKKPNLQMHLNQHVMSCLWWGGKMTPSYASHCNTWMLEKWKATGCGHTYKRATFFKKASPWH